MNCNEFCISNRRNSRTKNTEESGKQNVEPENRGNSNNFKRKTDREKK